MTLEEADRDAVQKWREWFTGFCDRFYAERCATPLYDYVRFSGNLPIRLKTQKPLKPRLADSIL